MTPKLPQRSLKVVPNSFRIHYFFFPSCFLSWFPLSLIPSCLFYLPPLSFFRQCPSCAFLPFLFPSFLPSVFISSYPPFRLSFLPSILLYILASFFSLFFLPSRPPALRDYSRCFFPLLVPSILSFFLIPCPCFVLPMALHLLATRETSKPRSLETSITSLLLALMLYPLPFFLPYIVSSLLPSPLHSFPLCFIPSLPLLFRFHRISFQEPNFDYRCKASSDEYPRSLEASKPQSASAGFAKR